MIATPRSSALFTDLYELTMMQGYFLRGLEHRVVFDMFFRRQPYHGGFAVFAGLDDLLRLAKDLPPETVMAGGNIGALVHSVKSVIDTCSKMPPRKPVPQGREKISSRIP